MAVYYGAGRYKAEVIEQAFTKSKSGKPMIVLTVEPTHRLDSDGWHAVARKTRTIRLVCDPASDVQIDFVLKKLRHAGWEGSSFGDLDMVGEAVDCDCDHGSYNGQPKEDWDLALPEKEPIAHDDSVGRELNAIFGKRLKGGKPAGATKRQPAPQAETPAELPAFDDDCPF